MASNFGLDASFDNMKKGIRERDGKVYSTGKLINDQTSLELSTDVTLDNMYIIIFSPPSLF
jgi:hypothetical protein